MKSKIILIFSLTLIVLLALLTGIYYWRNVKQSVAVINSDTAISGDYLIKNNQTTVVKNGATLTINGDLKVKGKLTCDGGPLNLIVKGDLVVDNLLECGREETDAIPNDIGSGISLVVEGSATFSENSVINSSGSVQIVESADLLAQNQEQLDKLYEEVESGGFGSLLPEKTGNVALLSGDQKRPLLLKVAEAQGGNVFKFAGKIKINPSPKGAQKQQITYIHATIPVVFENYEYYGADGNKGEDDIDNSCNPLGGDGGNAPILSVKAQYIELSNVKFFLGNGGRGGDAKTAKDCPLVADAMGGNGGKSGSFRFHSRTNIRIGEGVEFSPGINGDGGNAESYGGKGKNGCPGLPGVHATAQGGKGASHKVDTGIVKIPKGGGEYLSSNTFMEGAAVIGSIQGGNGGDAKAVAGEGGDGIGPGCGGGKGGNAAAAGGNGGDVPLKIAKANPGRGGSASARAGKGGRGGNCALPLNKGGKGGNGGNAQSTLGKGGLGPKGYGSYGVLRIEQGGDGGDGGNGDPPGSSGRVGKGEIPISPLPGKLGALDCVQESYFDVAPALLIPVVSQPESTPPPPTKTKFRPLTCDDTTPASIPYCKSDCEGIGYQGTTEEILNLKNRCITHYAIDKKCNSALNPVTGRVECQL